MFRIESDRARFRAIVRGRVRQDLRKYLSTGELIGRAGDRVVLEDHSSSGSFLNGRQVEDKAEPRVGDRLRLGPSDIEVQFIAVRPSDASS